MHKPVGVSGENELIGEPTFRAVAEAIGLGMAFQLAISADGETRQFTYLSPNCLELNGVATEAALADSRVLYDLIVPEQAERFATEEDAAFAAKTPFEIEVAMRRPDGEVRWHRIAAWPRMLPDGSSLWDGLQRDITQRQRIAFELEEQRRRMEVAVEATDLGLWELDLRSNALSWSERNRSLFGIASDAEIDLQSYLALIEGEDRARLIAAYRAAADAPGNGDFSAEYRVRLANGETRWIVSRGRVIRDEQGPRLIVGTSLDITEQHAADERRILLTTELAHRGKNFLAVIMSIVDQTARGMDSVEDFRDLLLSRLQAMATSQDLVTDKGGRAVDIAGVLNRSLAPFGLRRFDIDPQLEEVTVDGALAIGMGLLLHEMATNATKYGALSKRRGRVTIARAPAAAGRVAFEWREVGGPRVAPVSRRGFGTRLLQQVLRNNGGTVKFDFEPEGFRAEVDCPAAN